MVLKGFSEFINESTTGATYADLKLLLELGIVDDIQDDMYLGFDKGSISYDELLDWVTQICDKYEIEGWTLNSKGLIDVDRRVNLDNKSLTRLPLRFGEISVDFWCSFNQLTSLEGSPSSVGRNFSCTRNQLTSLEGGPNLVGGDFMCSRNYLITLEGSPQEVGGDFSCFNNELTTLEGAPKRVGGDFLCRSNQLTSLDGIGKVGGTIRSDIK
jgi:hypothetical protein